MAGPKIDIRHDYRARSASGRERAFALPGDVYNATPPRLLFGTGMLNRLPEVLADLGGRKALIVSTPGRQGLAECVATILGDACGGILPEAVSQVPIEVAIRGREQFRRNGADVIVSVGGGASIGLGKGIALGVQAPVIAIPTTYSGSEMTGFCGITIEGVKRMHTGLAMLAVCVIYDPELTLTLPTEVSAASAFNALAHCVDAVYLPTASPLIVAAAYEGARVLAQALPRVTSAPDNLDARSDLLYGAMLGGAALTGGFALQHGLAHVLGGSFGVAHGHSHAIILPHVAAYNAQFAPDVLGRLAAEMSVADLGQGLFDLLRQVGLPTSLREVGLDETILDRAVALTVETDNGLNPGPVSADGVRAILIAALEGRRPDGVGT
jgi:alcohol dehydrogenase class IV